MLKLYYSKDALEKAIKENISELACTLEQLHLFDIGMQQKYIETTYAQKILCIASSLNELLEKGEDKQLKELLDLIASESSLYSFDPRYVQEFGGSWTEKIDMKAGLNQKIINLCKRYVTGNGDNPDSYMQFVMFNSMKYLIWKDIGDFEIIKEETDKTDLDNLILLSKNKFDYIECPFEADMNGLCHLFAKDKSIHARLNRDEFELYLLNRMYQKLLSDLLEDDIQSISNILDIRQIVKRKLRSDAVFSDIAIEKFEKNIGSSEIDSILITYILCSAVRTKTCLEFDGKGRDHFLSDIDLFADEISIENVGMRFLAGNKCIFPDYNIGILKVKNAGPGFAGCANITSDEIILNCVGNGAMSGYNVYFSNHRIKKLTVDKAGDGFGEYSYFEADEIYLKSVGNSALGGLTDRFPIHHIGKLTVDEAGNGLSLYSNFKAGEIILKNVESSALAGYICKFSEHHIGKLTVNSAYDNFGAFSKIKADEVILKKILDYALISTEYRQADHQIEKLTVEQSGINLGEYSTLMIDRNNLNLPKGVKFKGKIYAKDKKWWEFWVKKAK